MPNTGRGDKKYRTRGSELEDAGMPTRIVPVPEKVGGKCESVTFLDRENVFFVPFFWRLHPTLRLCSLGFQYSSEKTRTAVSLSSTQEVFTSSIVIATYCDLLKATSVMYEP